MKAGRFREDLFYRLNVVELNMPPLRERREDILPLANLFIAEFARGRARLAEATVACLENYPWPGNVRELRNAMERAVLLSHSELILPEHLPTRVRDAAKPPAPPEAAELERLEEIERQAILAALQTAQLQPHGNREGAGHQPARADLQTATVPATGIRHRIV